jgi:hypothetical protein
LQPKSGKLAIQSDLLDHDVTNVGAIFAVPNVLKGRAPNEKLGVAVIGCGNMGSYSTTIGRTSIFCFAFQPDFGHNNDHPVNSVDGTQAEG